MKNPTLLSASLIMAFMTIACNEKEPLYVAERIARIVEASDNPAKDGTPTLQELSDAGVRNAVGDQILYEEAIATSDSLPTTLTELQDIINRVNDENRSGNNDRLVWSDEFENQGQPTSQKWTYDLGTGDWGWGNGEAQYYTQRAENVTVANGVLKITAKKENFQGNAYTSARIKTQGKFSFRYGKVEVRAKLPKGGGTWPAIWMLGNNISSVGWPACGEIDIMEHTGNNLGYVSSAIHNPSGYGDTPYVHKQFKAGVTDEFHLYGILWTEDKIDFTVDGVVHYTYKPAVKNIDNWPFSANQFIILNVAMGGSLGGNIDPDFTEGTMEIDYVRVYQ